MKFGLRLSLLLSLAACTVARPPESFLPMEEDDDDEPADPPPGFEDDDTDDDTTDDDAPERDARAPTRDSAVRNDAGAGRRDGATAEPGPGATGLAALHQQRYLMRMDMYSTASSSRPVQLEVKNRISNLLLVEFVVEDGKLSARERMCDQTYGHDCVTRSCVSWETKLSSDVKKAYFGSAEREVTRSYDLDLQSRELRASSATIPLGFDDSDEGKGVPTARDDARVWKVGDGRGMFSLMAAQVRVAVSNQMISCFVETAQRFTTEFAGELPGSDVSLDGATFPLNVEGLKGEVLDVRAQNNTSTSRMQCTEETFSASSGSSPKGTVRFKAYDGEGCPTNFDSMFPAAPAFM
jgi:hypothetical protein